MRVLLLVVLVAACGSDDGGEPDAFDHEMCLGDEEPLTPGTTAKLGTGGLFKIHVLATDPDPLEVGNNSLTIRVTDSNDTPVDGVDFDVTETWARIHDHGTPIDAEVAPLADPGEFTVTKMNVVHRGSWLFRFGPNDGSDSDLVEYNFGIDCP